MKIEYLITLFFLLAILPVSTVAQGFDNKPANGAGASRLRLSNSDEIGAEFDSVPCANSDRLNSVKALFERMGAADSEITIEKRKKVENLVIRKTGSQSDSGKIIIGAHFDKTEKGCGAVDNWSGVVTIAHVYRALREYLLNKTVIFVAFGDEEKGLNGSREMSDGIEKNSRQEYCAMINIDSLGMGAVQVADNLSSRKLVDLSKSVAADLKIPFNHSNIAGGDADSTSFLNKGVASVTIHGLTNEWPLILHTQKDTAAKVNATAVYLGYRLVLEMLMRIDSSPCSAFR
ncbi:MAG: M20/M25/M40 family metallo-hydrolase [Acidobacteria bacterium]|nr:M20/M25/M40 family metallo-hydrolase [Acidobacteriota bacterium]